MGIFNDHDDDNNVLVRGAAGSIGPPGIGFKLDANGDYDISGKKLTNVKYSTLETDAANKKYIDDQFTQANMSRNVFSKGIVMEGGRIEGLPAPVSVSDATRKSYVDAEITKHVNAVRDESYISSVNAFTYLTVSDFTATNNVLIILTDAKLPPIVGKLHYAPNAILMRTDRPNINKILNINLKKLTYETYSIRIDLISGKRNAVDLMSVGSSENCNVTQESTKDNDWDSSIHLNLRPSNITDDVKIVKYEHK